MLGVPTLYCTLLCSLHCHVSRIEPPSPVGLSVSTTKDQYTVQLPEDSVKIFASVNPQPPKGICWCQRTFSHMQPASHRDKLSCSFVLYSSLVHSCSCSMYTVFVSTLVSWLACTYVLCLLFISCVCVLLLLKCSSC